MRFPFALAIINLTDYIIRRFKGNVALCYQVFLFVK